MSDVISILELFQETGEGLLKAGVGAATPAPLLSAFLSNHTHEMTRKTAGIQPRLTETPKLFFSVLL